MARLLAAILSAFFRLFSRRRRRADRSDSDEPPTDIYPLY